MISQSIKKSRSHIIFLSLLIASISLFIINFIPIFISNEGITTQFSDNLWPNREMFVNKSNPNFNYNIYEYAGIISNSCEAYIHFNLELLPRETEQLYFFMYHYHFIESYPPPVEDIEINLILVGSNWSSSEITWNNKPKHEQIINTVNASNIVQSPLLQYYNFEKTIDLTELIENNHLSEISFCINITKNNVVLNDSIELWGIQLIWRYTKLLISNTTIITSIIIFSILIGTILHIRKDISSCSICKTKRKLTDKVCLSCKNNFREETFIKSADYQLILAIFWIFALFEISSLIWIWNTYVWPLFVLTLLSGIILINWTMIAIAQIVLKLKKYGRIRALLR
ncbi:MAG: DNRLRE domain-containing protein [Candidatus Heimdallarchaeota archaeon]